MDLLDLAEATAREAGALLRDRFGAPRTGVGTKSSATDMVSDADRAAEALILRLLLRARPDDGILAEESGARDGTSGVRWVIDPLDGTTNFLFGIPQFAVSIAAEDAQGVLAGVVYDVMRDECFTAARDAGAFRNGEPISASEKTDVGDALVATGFSYDPALRGTAAAILPAVLPKIRDIRRAGAASLDLAWTACGRVDAYVETPLEWWDVAAGSLLVLEAGGRTGDVLWAAGKGMIAAGAGVFEGVRALVQAAIDATPGSQTR